MCLCVYVCVRVGRKSVHYTPQRLHVPDVPHVPDGVVVEGRKADVALGQTLIVQKGNVHRPPRFGLVNGVPLSPRTRTQLFPHRISLV